MKRITTILVMCFLFLSCSDPVVGRGENQVDTNLTKKKLPLIIDGLSPGETRGSTNSGGGGNLVGKGKAGRNVNEVKGGENTGDDDEDENGKEIPTTGIKKPVVITTPPVGPKPTVDPKRPVIPEPQVDPKPLVDSGKERERTGKSRNLNHWERTWEGVKETGRKTQGTVRDAMKEGIDNIRGIFGK